MNLLPLPENLVMAQTSDGNFVMVESMAELENYVKKNPEKFTQTVEISRGRLQQDANGKWCWKFDNDPPFLYYHDA